MALELTLASFAFWFYKRQIPRRISDLSLSLFSGGTAHGCTEDDNYVGDAEGDEEVLQLISLVDSRWSTRGLQRSAVKDDKGAS